MSVVVGCPSCLEIKYTAARDAGACRRCKVPRRLLLNAEENYERIQRGITLDEWFSAPPVPTTRAGCEGGPRPCPHLRCRHMLGRGVCSLDASEFEHELGELAAAFGVTKQRAIELLDEAQASYRDVHELVLAGLTRNRAA